MKICFFHASMLSGGIERTIALLSEQYANQGDEVSIISISGEKSFYPLDKKVEYYCLDAAHNSLGPFQAFYNNIVRIIKLRRVLKRIKPDIIVTFGTSTALIALLSKFGIGSKLIGAERANPYSRSNSFWKRNTVKVAKQCDGFLFQTKGASEYYPVAVRDRSLIVQNGIDSSEFAKYDMAWNERKNICAVGRMDEDKNFEGILRAFRIIHETYPDVVLDLYGDGPLRSHLEELSDTWNLKEAVIFHGRTKNMPHEYASHKCFMMMSRCEGFPNVLLEAMAAGCVCVAGNCNFGPSDLIEDGVNGFLVDVEQTQTAAEKIIFVLQNDMSAEKVSRNAKQVRCTNDIIQISQIIHEFLVKTAEA